MRTFWITLKMVVVAPMPSASARTAAAVNVGCLMSPLMPYRVSWAMPLTKLRSDEARRSPAHASRVRSSIRVTLPKARRAA